MHANGWSERGREQFQDGRRGETWSNSVVQDSSFAVQQTEFPPKYTKTGAHTHVLLIKIHPILRNVMELDLFRFRYRIGKTPPINGSMR